MKLLICFGTRPEAIKMAPVYHQLQKDGHEVVVCNTAQHKELLLPVLHFFGIQPHYDLEIMQHNQSLNTLSAAILHKTEMVLQSVHPDWVLVHGDTTTAAMVALAAFHLQIKVAHVEAGLRTYNNQSPFPEEINRQLIGRIATTHFTPTALATQNLRNEQVPESHIIQTGNTVVDALHYTLQKSATATSPNLSWAKEWRQGVSQFMLITGHRRENFGEGFLNICHALQQLALQYPDVAWLYPVHLNPNVHKVVHQLLANIPNIHLVAPIDYPSFVYLMQQSYGILSDSGGVQEEAASLGKPLLLLRNTTERPEAVSNGNVLLVGTATDRIVHHTQQLLDNPMMYQQMSVAQNPFGDGQAAVRISHYFNNC